MQRIPRDSNDNGVVTMLVYHNKPTLLLTVHQHGSDDVTCIRSILLLQWPYAYVVYFIFDLRGDRRSLFQTILFFTHPTMLRALGGKEICFPFVCYTAYHVNMGVAARKPGERYAKIYLGFLNYHRRYSVNWF